MAHNPRNTLLATGVERLSRSKVYQKRALYKKIAAAKKKPVAAKPAAAPATVKSKTVGGAKNGKTRQVVLQKAPKFYPAEDVAAPKQVRKTSRLAKLRSTITPGTVLIMLAGRFRGKRVVFLKQLSSGLLLVTGPYKVNGVPLRRVNQAYVMATSTHIKVDAAKIPANLDDAYFKKPQEKKQKEVTEAGLFGDKQAKKEMDAKRVADQKTVDALLLAEIKKVPALKSYLNASFSLTKGQVPHLMKF